MEALQGEISRLLCDASEGDALSPDPSPDPFGRDFSSDWSAELLALKEIYGADFLPFNDRSNLFHIRIANGAGDTQPPLLLYFVIPINYPTHPCIVEVEPTSRLTRKQREILYTLLTEEANSSIGRPMVFNICNAALELLDCFDRGDAVAMSLLAQRGLVDGEFCTMFVDVDIWAEGEDGSTSSNRKPSQEQRLFTPTQFTGPVSEILARLPPSCEVIHIENVMRRDLALRFDRQQLEFYQKYVGKKRGSRLDANLNALSAVSVAFHGTQRHNVEHIVREGLVVPAQEKGVAVASGTRYGQGIYLSPSAEFSMHYCRGSGKLLVCAALLGKQWRCTGAEYGMLQCTHGYDSHVSPCGQELIVFNEAQVLPCFVVHYRERSQAEVRVCIQNQIVSEESGGHDRVKRLTAMARKNLPFGFGPGAHFEVLEIAPVDEDDEEYGDYQEMLRKDEEARDEYQDSVSAERHLQALVG